MKLENMYFKNKILIYSFVFLVFGVFFIMGKAEAQTAAASCICDVEVDDGLYCKGKNQTVFPVPLAKISRKQLVRDALSASNPNCSNIVLLSNSVSIMTEVIKKMGSLEDIIEVRDEQSCNSVSYSNSFPFSESTTGQFKYSISCSFAEKPAAAVSGGSAPLDCGKSVLGCNVDLSSLNTLKLTGIIGVRTLLGRVIRTMMGIIGSVALLMFVFGGFMWMTASGNAERAAKALRILTWSTLGIIVILSAYVLVDFVFSAF